jgi:holo-[acyl-carrier protein] synthase
VNLRFGLDLVTIDSVERNLADAGDRYLERIYTPGEIAASRVVGRPDPRRLAERFAVKEATLKVLPAADEGIDFRTIELVSDVESGRPAVIVHGRAAELATDSGVLRMAVSITSDDRLAAAAVVAEVVEADPTTR